MCDHKEVLLKFVPYKLKTLFIRIYYKFNIVLYDLQLKGTEELSKHVFKNQTCCCFSQTFKYTAR